MTNRSINNCAVLVIGLVLAFAVVEIMTKARAHALNRPEVVTATWQPPSIPYCDLDLWERVRTRCAESD
jgi:hypothetical protein